MPLDIAQLQKIDDYRWLIPRDTKPGMLTDALIYTDEHLLQDLLKDLSLEQAINVAMLPGIVGRSLAMPYIHQGYGFPIGGVAATDPEEGGVISPGGVGYDINCLSGTSLVLHEHGYTRRIDEMADVSAQDRLACFRLEPGAAESTGVGLW